MANATKKPDAMTEGIRNYVIADLNRIEPSRQEELKMLPGFQQAACVGDAPDLLVMPVDQGDQASTHSFVANGICSFVTSSLSLQALAERFGEKLYYFHPATGRLGSYAICVPMILSFFLLNAGPALAGYLTSDFTRIVARGYQGSVFGFTPTASTLQAKLMYPVSAKVFRNELTLPDAVRATPVQKIENSEWVVHACNIENVSRSETTYGTFPELTPDFIAAFELFQRRLCVRQLATAQASYLKNPFTVELEDQLLATARKCGYWDDLPFSSFAYSYLILGRDNLAANANFKCDADAHPNRALIKIETVRKLSAELRVRNLKRYGLNWDTDS